MNISWSAFADLRTPTLIVIARDDPYGTHASAQYMASHIAGAKFIDFDEGGPTWVGRGDAVMAANARLLTPPGRP